MNKCLLWMWHVSLVLLLLWFGHSFQCRGRTHYILWPEIKSQPLREWTTCLTTSLWIDQTHRPTSVSTTPPPPRDFKWSAPDRSDVLISFSGSWWTYRSHLWTRAGRITATATRRSLSLREHPMSIFTWRLRVPRALRGVAVDDRAFRRTPERLSALALTCLENTPVAAASVYKKHTKLDLVWSELSASVWSEYIYMCVCVCVAMTA